jgi:hypothetical protein
MGSNTLVEAAAAPVSSPRKVEISGLSLPRLGFFRSRWCAPMR